MSEISDVALWNSFKRGDKKSFQIIYQRYAPGLLNYGRRITMDISLLEDSIQDLFVELWNSGEKLSTPTSIKFYLFKALRYKIIRNKGVSNKIDAMPIEGFMTILKSPSEEDRKIQEETNTFKLQCLEEALRMLPDRQREAINLRYYHNFSNEEVASILGINYNSACKSIYAALKSLKGYLKVAVSITFFLMVLTRLA